MKKLTFRFFPMNAKSYLMSGIALCMLVVAVTFTACKKDDPEPQPGVEVDEVTLTVSADISAEAAGGSYPVTVTCNTAWTAAVNTEAAAWCSVNPPSGNGNGTVNVAVTPNADDTRSATITVRAGTLTETVTVTQLGTSPSLTATGNGTDNIPNKGGTATISITANVTWTAIVASAATAWCDIDPAAGTNSGTITVTVSPNPVEALARTAMISIIGVGEGITPATIQVSQVAGEPVALNVTPTSLDNLSDAGTTTSLNIQTDGAWTATVNADDTWCTISPTSGNGNGSANVTVSPNYSAARSATITVTAGAATSQQIGVTQIEGEPSGVTFNVSPSLIEAAPTAITENQATVLATALTYTIEVIAPAAWTADVSDESWFHLEKTSGSGGTETVTLIIDYFKGDNAVTSNIVFSYGTEQKTVTVKDNYRSAIITTANGTKWAPTSVDAAGRFAATRTQYKLYQFNRNTPYPAVKPGEAAIDGYNTSSAPAGEWTDTPCPAGWTMPDLDTHTGQITCTGEVVTVDGYDFAPAGNLWVGYVARDNTGKAQGQAQGGFWYKNSDGKVRRFGPNNGYCDDPSGARDKLWAMPVRCISVN
jgi:hypothetical protein